MASLSIVDGKYAMKDGPTDTLFGLIGATRGRSNVKTLGGLVDGGKPSAKTPSGLVKKKVVPLETGFSGPNKTKIPGAHYGMVPYAGQFMAKVGPKV